MMKSNIIFLQHVTMCSTGSRRYACPIYELTSYLFNGLIKALDICVPFAGEEQMELIKVEFEGSKLIDSIRKAAAQMKQESMPFEVAVLALHFDHVHVDW